MPISPNSVQMDHNNNLTYQSVSHRHQHQVNRIFSIPQSNKFLVSTVRPKYSRAYLKATRQSMPSPSSASSSISSIHSQCPPLLNSLFNGRKLSLLTISVMLLSYTGAAALAALLTFEYFQYQTTTRIEIVNPTHSELPAFSICLFYILPDLSFEDGSTDSWIESSLTLGEIDSRLPKFKSFITDCMVLDTDYKYKPCLNITPKVVEYLSLYSKCYTLFEKMNQTIIYDRGRVGSNFLVKLHVNQTGLTTKTLGIFITHHTQELDEALGNPGFLQLDFERTNKAIATYERTVIKSLQSPYDSRCRDYSKEGCLHRKTCIKRCILESSFNVSRGFINRRYVKILDHRLSGRFGIQNESVNTIACINEYHQPPCNDYIYRAIPGIQIYSPFIPQGIFEFSLSYPLGTEIRVQYVPYRPFLDYLIFVFSVVALWTEFSVSRTLFGIINCIQIGILKRFWYLNNNNK